MNTVTTISLAGRSYTLEESGYASLKTYLDQTTKSLDGNPDKEEILKDFEMAVAEKFERYLNANKNVITIGEIEIIINEMGPVDTDQKSDGHTAHQSDNHPEHQHGKEHDQNGQHVHPKKLYRIMEGSKIGGVCTGLAAYFNIDDTLVRVIFIVLAVITHGGWILVYFVMMVILPVANTPHEKAEASGSVPINIQEIIKKAKEGYGNFKNSKEWKQWKHQMKEERKRWKYSHRHAYRYEHGHHRRHHSPFYELMGSIMGMLWLAFMIFLFWFAYNHIGVVHHTFDTIGLAWEHLMDKIASKF